MTVHKVPRDLVCPACGYPKLFLYRRIAARGGFFGTGLCAKPERWCYICLVCGAEYRLTRAQIDHFERVK